MNKLPTICFPDGTSNVVKHIIKVAIESNKPKKKIKNQPAWSLDYWKELEYPAAIYHAAQHATM